MLVNLQFSCLNSATVLGKLPRGSYSPIQLGSLFYFQNSVLQKCAHFTFLTQSGFLPLYRRFFDIVEVHYIYYRLCYSDGIFCSRLLVSQLSISLQNIPLMDIYIFLLCTHPLAQKRAYVIVRVRCLRSAFRRLCGGHLWMLGFWCFLELLFHFIGATSCPVASEQLPVATHSMESWIVFFRRIRKYENRFKFQDFLRSCTKIDW